MLDWEIGLVVAGIVLLIWIICVITWCAKGRPNLFCGCNCHGGTNRVQPGSGENDGEVSYEKGGCGFLSCICCRPSKLSRNSSSIEILSSENQHGQHDSNGNANSGGNVDVERNEPGCSAWLLSCCPCCKGKSEGKRRPVSEQHSVQHESHHKVDGNGQIQQVDRSAPQAHHDVEANAPEPKPVGCLAACCSSCNASKRVTTPVIEMSPDVKIKKKSVELNQPDGNIKVKPTAQVKPTIVSKDIVREEVSVTNSYNVQYNGKAPVAGLPNTEISSARPPSVSLSSTSLHGADLPVANLPGSVDYGINIPDVNAVSSVDHSVDLPYAKLEGTVDHGINLTNAKAVRFVDHTVDVPDPNLGATVDHDISLPGGKPVGSFDHNVDVPNADLGATVDHDINLPGAKPVGSFDHNVDVPNASLGATVDHDINLPGAKPVGSFDHNVDAPNADLGATVDHDINLTGAKPVGSFDHNVDVPNASLGATVDHDINLPGAKPVGSFDHHVDVPDPNLGATVDHDINLPEANLTASTDHDVNVDKVEIEKEATLGLGELDHDKTKVEMNIEQTVDPEIALSTPVTVMMPSDPEVPETTLVTEIVTPDFDVGSIGLVDADVDPNGKLAGKEMKYELSFLDSGDINQLTCHITHESSATEVEVTRHHQSERVTYTFTPTKPGYYVITIRYSDKEIPPSPVRLLVVSPATRVTTKGLGTSHLIGGEQLVFSVDCSEAGDSDPNVHVHEDGLKLDVKKEGRVFVYANDAAAPGVYAVDVKYAEEHVPGSPFTVTVNAPPPAPAQEKVDVPPTVEQLTEEIEVPQTEVVNPVKVAEEDGEEDKPAEGAEGGEEDYDEDEFDEGDEEDEDDEEDDEEDGEEEEDAEEGGEPKTEEVEEEVNEEVEEQESDGEETDGEETDGEVTDGEETDGQVTDGEETDCEVSDGEEDVANEDGTITKRKRYRKVYRKRYRKIYRKRYRKVYRKRMRKRYRIVRRWIVRKVVRTQPVVVKKQRRRVPRPRPSLTEGAPPKDAKPKYLQGSQSKMSPEERAKREEAMRKKKEAREARMKGLKKRTSNVSTTKRGPKTSTSSQESKPT